MFVSHILVWGVWLFTAPSSAIPGGGHCLHSPLCVCVPSRWWQRKWRKNERSNLAHQISLKGRSWKLQQGLFTSPIGPCLARWPYLAANEAVNSSLHFRYLFPLHGRMVDFFFFFFLNKAEGFSGSPVIKTLHFQCRECVFDPWSGDWDPTCHVAWPKKKEKGNKAEWWVYCRDFILRVRKLGLRDQWVPESGVGVDGQSLSGWQWALCWSLWGSQPRPPRVKTGGAVCCCWLPLLQIGGLWSKMDFDFFWIMKFLFLKVGPWFRERRVWLTKFFFFFLVKHEIILIAFLFLCWYYFAVVKKII